MHAQEDENKKKQLIRAAISLTVSALVLLVMLPIGKGLNPLRRLILQPFSLFFGQDNEFLNSLGNTIYSCAVFTAAAIAFRSLKTLLDHIAGKQFHITVKWDNLLFIGVSCVLGLSFLKTGLRHGDGIFTLIGLGLVTFGLWYVYKTLRDARTSRVLNQDGETVVAEIVNITRGSISVDDAYIYTVTCRADGRYYTEKTRNPLNSSYIGKKVPVRVSAGSPDIYDIDLDNIIWLEGDNSEASDPPPPAAAASGLAEQSAPNAAASVYSWRWNEPETAKNEIAASDERRIPSGPEAQPPESDREETERSVSEEAPAAGEAEREEKKMR